MTIREIFSHRWVRCLGLAGIAATGYVAGMMTEHAAAQQIPGPPLPAADKRIVAYIYGNIPVTREELGDFLINRGGYSKLELLVNKKIIEIEAARRNITITPNEIEAALGNDLRTMDLSVKEFTEKILPRYNKTLYEWEEDVIKPRLLLGKMCQDNIQITEEDLRKNYENKYGERRQAKIIIWKNDKDNLKIAEKQWNEANQSDADFDRVARGQFTPSLAASAGLIAPIGRFPEVEDETCAKKLYTLKNVGEMTELFQTPAGIMCMKFYATIQPDTTVFKITDQKLTALKQANVPQLVISKITALKNKDFARGDLTAELSRLLTADEFKQHQLLIFNHAADATASFDQIKPILLQDAKEKRLTVEIPKFFAKLKEAAQPNLLLKGAPSPSDALLEIQNLEQPGGIQQTGGVQPNPMPKKQ
jgi:hypothetical protein